MFKYPEEYQKEIEEIIDIQNYLHDIEAGNIAESADFLYHSFMLQDPNNYFRFFLNLNNAILERLPKLYLFADLIMAINKHFIDDGREFKSIFLKNIICQSFQKDCTSFRPAIPFIINLLLIRGMFTIDELLDRIIKIPDEYKSFEVFIHYFSFFYPEFLEHRQEIYVKMVKEIPFQVEVAPFIRSNEYKQFYENVKSYSENDWKIFKENRASIDSGNDLLRIIREDDIKAFRSFSAHPEFEINDSIRLDLFTPYDYLLSSPPYISFAAFFGAVNIFKFLLAKGADLDKTDQFYHGLAQFAVIGGNLEIIRLLEQANVSFDGTFQVSAGFSRYEIFDWLHATRFPDINHFDPKRKTVINQATMQNNLYIFLRCIEEDADLFFKDTDGTATAAYKVCLFGSYDVAKFLFMIPKCDYTSAYINLNPINSVALEGHIELFNLLVDFFKIKLNMDDISNLIMYSIKHTQFTRYLLSLPWVEPHQILSPLGENIIMLAAEYDNYIILKDHINNPKIDINKESQYYKSPLESTLINYSDKCMDILLQHPNIKYGLRKNFRYDVFVARLEGTKKILNNPNIKAEFIEYEYDFKMYLSAFQTRASADLLRYYEELRSKDKRSWFFKKS